MATGRSKPSRKARHSKPKTKTSAKKKAKTSAKKKTKTSVKKKTKTSAKKKTKTSAKKKTKTSVKEKAKTSSRVRSPPRSKRKRPSPGRPSRVSPGPAASSRRRHAKPPRPPELAHQPRKTEDGAPRGPTPEQRRKADELIARVYIHAARELKLLEERERQQRKSREQELLDRYEQARRELMLALELWEAKQKR